MHNSLFCSPVFVLRNFGCFVCFAFIPPFTFVPTLVLSIYSSAFPFGFPALRFSPRYDARRIY